jgi:tetratricopeptide (TPR) repeat protein
LPADIPAPGIQATPVTTDVFPSDSALLAQPTPTPKALAPTQQPVRRAPTQQPATSTTSTPNIPAVNQAQLSQMVAQASEKQDPRLATKAGWAYLAQNQYSSAGMWFNQALEWSPGPGEAAYGLALSKFREGDLSNAEAIVNYRGDSHPKMRILKGDISSRRAVEAYEMKNNARSRDLMLQASEARPLNRNEQTILAWDYYHTKDYAKSSALFEKLYRASPSENTAQGLYASLAKTKSYDKVDVIGDTVRGLLKKMYGTSEARRYFAANLFVASAGAGGEKIYPVLKNYTSPSVALGLAYWSKSTTEGEGKLSAGYLPIVSGRIYPSNKTILTAQVSRIVLNSGTLNQGANVGKVPTTFTPYAVSPTTSYNSLFDFSVRFEYQDWVSWYVTFGNTPSGRPLNAKPIGNIGMLYRTEQGYFQAELYSKAVRESILTYVGMTDPYTGATWGGVTQSGGMAQFFHSIAPKWTIFLKGSYGILTSTDVKDNYHLALTAALAYEFEVKNFEYIFLGLACSYETYDNNRNHFTYGNGGYFSPEYVAQALIQAQFLSQEGKRWIAAGSLGLSVQNNKQASSPNFPLDPDGRNYPGTEDSTVIGLVNAEGGYLVSPNWLVGAAAGYAVTADNHEGYISVYVRYFFEGRNGLLRTDLGLDRP